jgi:PPOX class probable F420-dependent enzyme
VGVQEVQNRFYDAMRSRRAHDAARGPGTEARLDPLRGHKYALLTTFKKSGEPVPTPIWFGLDDEGRAYVRTGSEVAKVRRIRNDSHVRMTPCTVRGKPKGPTIEGTARLVPQDEKPHAERALQSNYGLGRRLYERIAAPGDLYDAAYIEVTPRSASPGSGS